MTKPKTAVTKLDRTKQPKYHLMTLRLPVELRFKLEQRRMKLLKSEGRPPAISELIVEAVEKFLSE